MAEATPRPWSLGVLFVAVSQLNGFNGEWTGSDDLAARIQQVRDNAQRMRVAQNKRPTGARAGNGGYGPPLPQHARPPDQKAAKGGGSLTLREPCVVENVQGISFVAQDALLTGEQVSIAAKNVSSYEREVNSDYVQNAAHHLGVAGQKEAAHQVREDVAQYQQLMRDIARSNIKASPMWVASQVGEKVASRCIDNLVEADPMVVQTQVQALLAKRAYLRQTQDARLEIAQLEFEEAQIREMGEDKKKDYVMVATRYVKHVKDENGRMVAVPNGIECRALNVCPVASDASQEVKEQLSVPLVPVPYYVKAPNRGFWNWFFGGMFSVCYRWHYDRERKVWRTANHAEVFYPPELENLRSVYLNEAVDNATMRNLLDNYRFLGWQSSWVAAWYNNGLGYFETRGLTAAVCYKVHPAIVEMARNEAQGCTVSDAFTKQQLKDLKKYEEWVPPDVVAQSIAVGLQQRDALEYLFPAGLKAAKFVEDA